jgi:copper-(or silver)-translocating P-type ATPase
MAAVLSGEPCLISSVPGRQRWSTPSLHRSPRLAAAVEVAVQKISGVVKAEGNPTTGRLLVFYQKDQSSDLIRQAVCAAVARAVPMPEDEFVARREALAAMRSEPDSRGLDGPVKKMSQPCPIEGSCCDIQRDQSDDKLQVYRRKLWLGGIVLLGVIIRRIVVGAVVGGPVFMAVTALATIITGRAYLKGAFNSLFRKGRVNTDTLVGTATIASILLGETASGLIVIWLLNLGEYLQGLTIRRTRQAIRDLLSVDNAEVWLVEGEVETQRPIASIQTGNLVAVYAGEKIPVDGVIELGEATINEAPITGESMPVERTVGGRVFAGTLLMAGRLRIRVESVGADTAIGRLIRRVEEAQELKPRIQTVGEQFAIKFVPFSFILAGVVFLLSGNPTQALTMLLIACPCAAGLATPTAVSASIGNAAKRGILIKGGTHLESASELNVIVFDKTGTLTQGTPSVHSVVTHNDGYTMDDVLAIAAGAEIHSQHPLALAIIASAKDRDLELPPHDECEIVAGRGIRADTPEGPVFVGSRRLLADNGIFAPEVDGIDGGAQSIVYVAHRNRFIGQIAVSDSVRPGAADALERLRSIGVPHLLMLTGDNEQVAANVAREVTISEWRSRLLPEEKFDWIRRLRADGHRVAMVGDGVNDAPALALADVGIAMGTGGSDIAIEAADIALAADNLDHVATTVQLSRRTIKLIRQNYSIALGVNSIGIVAGAFGALNPLFAAILHNVSTIMVVINSTRLIKYDPSIIDGMLREARAQGPILTDSLPMVEAMPITVDACCAKEKPATAAGAVRDACCAEEKRSALAAVDACCAEEKAPAMAIVDPCCAAEKSAAAPALDACCADEKPMVATAQDDCCGDGVACSSKLVSVDGGGAVALAGSDVALNDACDEAEGECAKACCAAAN